MIYFFLKHIFSHTTNIYLVLIIAKYSSRYYFSNIVKLSIQICSEGDSKEWLVGANPTNYSRSLLSILTHHFRETSEYSDLMSVTDRLLRFKFQVSH